MIPRNLTLLTLAATVSSACFVDLDRDEAFLSVTLESLSSLSLSPAVVALRLDSEVGLDPFEIRLPLDPDTNGRAQLPVLGATAGQLQLELRLLDEAGGQIGEPRRYEVLLRRGETTAILVAYGEIPSLPGPSGQPPRNPGSGLTVVERLELADAPVGMGAQPGSETMTEVPIDRGQVEATLARLTADLGGPATRLDLRGLIIASLPPVDGESPPELDDVFAGQVAVSLRSSALDELEIARFDPGDVSSIELDLVPTVNLDAWLGDIPVDATLVLTAPPSTDGDDEVEDFRLRITLLIAGGS